MNGEMIRIQVYLDTELNNELEILASRLKISRAELIRQSIRMLLQIEKVNEEDPILGVIGLGKSGKKDISEKHDSYLAEKR